MNSIDKELLSILVCPETHQPVHMAEQSLIDTLNEQIKAGSLSNRIGESISDPLDAGLIRKDGTVLFPIRSGIPVMMVDESIKI